MMLDTRRMEVAILAPKREQIIALLVEWMSRKIFNLRDISSLHGSLESLTRYIKWHQVGDHPRIGASGCLWIVIQSFTEVTTIQPPPRARVCVRVRTRTHACQTRAMVIPLLWYSS
jgi:hypothetical protein